MAEKSEIRLNLLEPRATEKTYNEQTKRVYVFPVEREMSKQAIAAMVEKEFNVTVTDVKTLIRKGKKTRYSKGKRADLSRHHLSARSQVRLCAIETRRFD